MTADTNANISRHLDLMAAARPDSAAVKVPVGNAPDGSIRYLSLSFSELAAEVAAWRAKLAVEGVRRGDRTLVMVRQGLPLIAAVFALFGLGAVPVVLDPGMGRKSFLACVARSQPRVLLGIPLARLMSRLWRKPFASVRVRVAASSNPAARLAGKAPPGGGPPTAVCAPDELAAILFTSGSTGAPKGVCYTHGMLAAQVELVRETYGIRPGEVDLPLLPVFALFNPALGMTTIVPETDPRRVAASDPAKIVRAILQENVTNSFGSPTLWALVGDHCKRHNLRLPSLRRVLCAGAAVPPKLWRDLRDILPGGEIHSPYGATEILPLTDLSATEALDGLAVTLGGGGSRVGKPLPGNKVRVIAITDAPVATLGETRQAAVGEIGEIIATGPAVTREYDRLPDATALAKITDADTGEIWHRMGDCGYLDAGGNLWFCGRKTERVVTPQGVLFTGQVEPVFNAHPAVRRSALIGLSRRGRPGVIRPAIVIEPRDPRILKNTFALENLINDLRLLALKRPLTADINLFYFRGDFPVDVRHNAKIHRNALARWAAGARGHKANPLR
ncbi:MAG: AMP-binding protein [Opitutaceae bacterium]|jgi:acyl-CoA synthetase (AMP-forming)/AMP-acid ligase II|nr:AMP-binding protein [Opitutaceae bacterium]